MSSKKKVLFSIGSLEIGGAEIQMVLLIEGLMARGWQCDVLVLQTGGPLTERLCAAGANIYDSGFKTGRGLLIILEIIKAIYKSTLLVRKQRYQIVHGYLPLANFIVAVAGTFCRVPQIYTSKRALGTHQQRHPMWKTFDVIANYVSDRIVANSQGVKDDVVLREGVAPERIDLIYNGLDFHSIESASGERYIYRKELGLQESDLAVVVVANLIAYKGHADVIKAASKLGADKARVVFVFVGEDRGQQGELEQLAAVLSVPRIQFLGRRADVPSLLAAADIGLVSSHEEGFCNALLEQMAAGLPVIATRVGGNAEALDGGKFGLLIDAHAPDQMAESITKLVADPLLRKSLGGKASLRVQENYSVETMVSNHIELYLSGDAK